jgi:PhnB protein
MQLNCYLLYNGQCEAAFKFYEKCLGGKIISMTTHEGTPMAGHVPPEWGKKIIHARLVAGGHVLMGSDAPPGHFREPGGFSVSVTVPTTEEADRLFAALSENGKITMPIQKTFWSPRFGMFVDQFGIPWMINCEPAA